MKISKEELRKIIKEEILKESGHTDVPSSRANLFTIVEDCDDMLKILSQVPKHASLPSWWTNKIAVASNKLNACRDYLLTSVGGVREESMEESDSLAEKQSINMKEVEMKEAVIMKHLTAMFDELGREDLPKRFSEDSLLKPIIDRYISARRNVRTPYFDKLTGRMKNK